MRATGKTTRKINQCIDELLSYGITVVTDEPDCTKEAVWMICQRINAKMERDFPFTESKTHQKFIALQSVQIAGFKSALTMKIETIKKEQK